MLVLRCLANLNGIFLTDFELNTIEINKTKAKQIFFDPKETTLRTKNILVQNLFTPIKDTFRTMPNIYDGAFLWK